MTASTTSAGQLARQLLGLGVALGLALELLTPLRRRVQAPYLISRLPILGVELRGLSQILVGGAEVAQLPPRAATPHERRRADAEVERSRGRLFGLREVAVQRIGT